jgi:predicted transcriptional regulator
MSVKEDNLRTQIIEHLRMFPLGKEMDEIVQEFNATPEEIEEVLENLEEESLVINAAGKYRWTGS